jgi:integrase/recombinase XerD
LSDLSRNSGAATIKSHICTLKSFFKFLKIDGYIHENPIAGMGMPKQKFCIPEIFSYEEFELLIKASQDTTYPLRNKAILEVLFGCGLRASEVCNLTLSDIANRDLIRVTGKGSKERLVPIGKYARKAVKTYLDKTIIKHRHTDHVFLNRYGTQLTRHTIHKVTTQVGKIAGIDNVHPHRFRHSFATVLLLGGADIRVVQDMLGHENIRSTEIYLHLKLCDVVKKFKKTHPRYNAT